MGSMPGAPPGGGDVRSPSTLAGQAVNAEGLPQSGVGLFLEQQEPGGPLYVKTIFKGSATDRGRKVQLGDEVVAVNGERVEGRTPSSLRNIIVGPQGTYCRIGLRRGNTEFEVKLLRGTAESLNILVTKGLELHEELDAVKESLRLVESQLEEERRKRLAESSRRREVETVDRSGWKEERKRLLDALEAEQRARKESEQRERRLLDERVQEALSEKERMQSTDRERRERSRTEELLGLERKRAAEAEAALRTKEEHLRQLQEQVRAIGDRATDTGLRAALHQAEEREQGLLQALEQERLRYEEQLRAEQEKRIAEQGRRQASEEREQQLLRQLEDERFRWGEALRLEEQRARLSESSRREDEISELQSREEKLRAQSLDESRRQWHDEKLRLEERLADVTARRDEALAREAKLLEELKRRGGDESGRRADVEQMRAALEEDRVRLEEALWELNERLKAETQKRQGAEQRENHLVEELRAIRRNTGDAAVRRDIDAISNRVPSDRDHANRSGTAPPGRDLNLSSTSTNYPTTPGNNVSGVANVGNASVMPPVGRGSVLARDNATDSAAPMDTKSQSVPNLIGLLTSRLPNTVREAAYALGLVAIEAQGRAAVLELPQSVFRLEGLLASNDQRTVRYAALALGNLAMDSSGRRAILNVANAVENLATLLRHDDSETVRYAALALGNIVLEERGRVAVLAYPASVPHLASQLSAGDKQTVRYACGALRNIAVEEAGRRAVRSNPEAVTQLRSLTSAQDPATSRYAAAALKNLSIGAE